MPLYAVGSGSRWDDRRNTSETRGPDPRALDECLRACAILRRRAPKLTAWLEQGAPPIRSDSDHRRMFGRGYEKGALT